ncbi:MULTISPECIES: thiolase family protein [Mycolicibacterium]|jgi:acetyl-CoA C-acetyltransferase|uniref:Thiolase family protein n=2 Tax=Mycolicibacterium austroafricanum TaxID=39687 RepID=A0ABT8HCD5_MYCAO|nr:MULTISPECIES: thiolase family protein [Mycolicibacterium]MDN4518374.1 thiolase family protein [Mycolicibacterium austroafricanum]MDW5610748.1 thiolase family protein [Mycolicibacterium sp. D5.8-2]QRZ08612.1 thiolase family protein [Mycolicibacterium austroafricanum]QZT70262.1 thiolase family protein [Mycolicibacterium austroafricanum]QZY48063.1 thiolase family protein [Mycolicibacterium austroafricanum]
MPTPVIVGAARTAIGRSFKGTLVNTPPETLITTVLPEVVRRSGVDPADIDDIIFAESHYGGGDLARYAADAVGLQHVPGQSVNRHCAGSLTAIGNASAQIGSGMERVLIAGGVQSLSMTPLVNWRIPGPELKFEERWMPPTHVETPDAPTKDMSITVGWNTAQAAGITREEMDVWAVRSHQRAVAAIDAGKFVDEIVPLKVTQFDGSVIDFSVDESPRRDTTLEKLAGLKVLHPEIEGFSITAGNASGTNDAAAGVALVDADYAAANGLNVMAKVRAWGAVGVAPRDTGLGGVKVIGRVLDRAGLKPSDVALWEINEAFASVPIAACKEYGIDEELVNFSGSGCSLGHPIAASGARMITTLIYELQRRGGGIGVAAMCAGGGQGGGVVIEV